VWEVILQNETDKVRRREQEQLVILNGARERGDLTGGICILQNSVH